MQHERRHDTALVPHRPMTLLHRAFVRLDAIVHRVLQERHNPLTRTGAMALACLLVAVVTGVLLLFWYTPSVEGAWRSVRGMEEARWTAGLVRSAHRYSSDACLLFATLHVLKILAARRFGGARWLAWSSGLVLVALTWSIGWLGYWLVWDERAHLVARGTALVVDVLPLFDDPLARSLLADQTLPGTLFFLVFFLHLVLPLAIALALWVHVLRLSRPRLMPDRRLLCGVAAATLVLCALVPAVSAPPARMAVEPSPATIDAWYLAPLWFTERLSPRAIWAVALAAFVALALLPWLFGRKAPATVDAARCTECTRCLHDCPHDAIRMVPRAGEAGRAMVAAVDPSRCVGCGVCAGCCDPAAIGIEPKPEHVRQRVDRWLATEPADRPRSIIVWLCAGAVPVHPQVDPATGRTAGLPPRLRVVTVPCAGWLHPLTVERALRHGAAGAIIVTCEPGNCAFREGWLWTQERMSGHRPPVLREDPVGPPVRVLSLSGGGLEAITRAAEELVTAWSPAHGLGGIHGRPGDRHGRDRRRSRARAVASAAAGLALAAAFCAVTIVPSDLPYRPRHLAGSELVVSFLHPGEVGQRCRELSPEEIASRPAHMRRTVECDRARAPVRLRVRVDGHEVHRRSYPPGGLFGDRASVAIERLPMDRGHHEVAIDIGDTQDPRTWSHRAARTVHFASRGRRVVIFDRTRGFAWY